MAAKFHHEYFITKIAYRRADIVNSLNKQSDWNNARSFATDHLSSVYCCGPELNKTRGCNRKATFSILNTKFNTIENFNFLILQEKMLVLKFSLLQELESQNRKYKQVINCLK